jgi:hypothetical protein
MQKIQMAVSSFRYYAVYPDGRRCEVNLEDLEKYGKRWESEEGVTIETDFIRQLRPAYGHVNVVTL